MRSDELRLYFLAWTESLAEMNRLALLPPSPAVDRAYARAQANEEYDRRNFFRLRAKHKHEDNG